MNSDTYFSAQIFVISGAEKVMVELFATVKMVDFLQHLWIQLKFNLKIETSIKKLNSLCKINQVTFCRSTF